MDKWLEVASSGLCFGLIARYYRGIVSDNRARQRAIRNFLRPGLRPAAQEDKNQYEAWWILIGGFLDDKSFAKLTATCQHLRRLERDRVADDLAADGLAAHALAHLSTTNCDFARVAGSPAKVCCGEPIATFHYSVRGCSERGNLLERTRTAHLCFQCGRTVYRDRLQADGLLDPPPLIVGARPSWKSLRQIPRGFASRTPFTLGRWLVPTSVISAVSVAQRVGRLLSQGELLSQESQEEAPWIKAFLSLMTFLGTVPICYVSGLSGTESVVNALLHTSQLGNPFALLVVIYLCFLQTPLTVKFPSTAWVLDLLPLVALAWSALKLKDSLFAK
jgi:hypothetical protein